MPDLKTHLREIERVPPSDLWREIELRAADDANVVRLDLERPRDHDHLRKVLTVAVALLLAIAAIGGAVSVFRSAEQERPGGPSITPENVADLGLAWTGAVPKIYSGVHLLVAGDGSVFASGGEVFGFDEACGTGGVSCEPSAMGFRSHVSPTLADGVLYAAADQVLAVSASCRSNCTPLWTAPRMTHSGGVTEPVVSDGVVYVAWQSGVFAFPARCATDGSECAPMGSGIANELIYRHAVLAGRTLVVAGGQFYPIIRGQGHSFGIDTVYGFATSCLSSRPDCTPIWKVRSGSDPVGADGMVYVAAPKGKVVAFDDACVSDCSPVWRTARRNGGPAAAGDGYVFVVRGGTLSAFAATCGTGGANCEPAWTADVSLYGSLTVSDGLLVLSSIPTASAGDLTAFPAACTTGGATCDPLWTAPDLVDPVIAGGVVYAVGRDGHQLFAFDERCGTGGETCRPLWTGSTHGIIRTAPVVDGGGVYVGTGDSKVVAFRLGAGGTAGSGSPLPITTILVLVVLAAGGVVIVLRRRARALARETL